MRSAALPSTNICPSVSRGAGAGVSSSHSAVKSRSACTRPRHRSSAAAAHALRGGGDVTELELDARRLFTAARGISAPQVAVGVSRERLSVLLGSCAPERPSRPSLARVRAARFALASQRSYGWRRARGPATTRLGRYFADFVGAANGFPSFREHLTSSKGAASAAGPWVVGPPPPSEEGIHGHTPCNKLCLRIASF